MQSWNASPGPLSYNSWCTPLILPKKQEKSLYLNWDKFQITLLLLSLVLKPVLSGQITPKLSVPMNTAHITLKTTNQETRKSGTMRMPASTCSTQECQRGRVFPSPEHKKRKAGLLCSTGESLSPSEQGLSYSGCPPGTGETVPSRTF